MYFPDFIDLIDFVCKTFRWYLQTNI